MLWDPAVEKAWQKQFNHPISFHPLMNSEGVIEQLKAYKPQSVNILTAAEGRELIKTYCMKNSISYTQINTYLRVPLKIDLEALQHLYASENDIVLTVTSSDILLQFMKQMEASLKQVMLSLPVVVGAKRIAILAEELGFKTIHLADSPTDESMSQSVKMIKVD